MKLETAEARFKSEPGFICGMTAMRVWRINGRAQAHFAVVQAFPLFRIIKTSLCAYHCERM